MVKVRTEHQTGPRRVLALGSVYVDINGAHMQFDTAGLKPEQEIVGDAYESTPGGSSVNFARVCQRLGLPSVCIGKTGADALGTVLADSLRTAGVQPALVRDGAVATNVGINLVNDAGQSIMAVMGTANQSLTLADVQTLLTANLANCSYLLLGGCFKLKVLLPALADVMTAAQKTGVQVIVDHGRLNDGVSENEKALVKQLASQADYYLPSADELQDLWGVKSIEVGLMHLAATATGQVVVKDGTRGAVTMIDSKIVRVDALHVQARHTVGAGDAFNAGLIAAQGSGRDLLESVRFACATAALYVSAPEQLDWRAVESLLQKQIN